MKIKEIELKNFNRFASLRIADIPPTAKLIVIIGANGSGKSSLLEAFGWVKQEILAPNIHKKLSRFG